MRLLPAIVLNDQSTWTELDTKLHSESPCFNYYYYYDENEASYEHVNPSCLWIV